MRRDSLDTVILLLDDLVGVSEGLTQPCYGVAPLLKIDADRNKDSWNPKRKRALSG